jgi:hypothetical protein
MYVCFRSHTRFGKRISSERECVQNEKQNAIEHEHSRPKNERMRTTLGREADTRHRSVPLPHAKQHRTAKERALASSVIAASGVWIKILGWLC